jgi:hypothetical protein
LNVRTTGLLLFLTRLFQVGKKSVIRCLENQISASPPLLLLRLGGLNGSLLVFFLLLFVREWVN